MVIFKCPYCQAEYEMTTARLSFRQRSYAKCHVCYRTMYSWTSRNVNLSVARLIMLEHTLRNSMRTAALVTLREGCAAHDV